MIDLSRRAWVALAFAVVASGAPAEPTPARMIFGLISPRGRDRARVDWQPFVTMMGATVHSRIDITAYAQASDLVAQFRTGRVDVAWMGNEAALQVVELGFGSVFAQMVNKRGGAGYYSVLVVPGDSSIRSLPAVLEKAADLSFGDGDIDSTSGHMFPLYFAFEKNGINDPRKIFKSVTTGNHQKNLMMVSNREVDVATANTEELAIFERDHPERVGAVRVIWQSPLIPQSPLVLRNSLAPETRRRLTQFVTYFGAHDGERAILDRLNGLSGFRLSSNRQLVAIADIEMYKVRQAIINDPRLSPQEREMRIDEAIRRASHLEILLKISADMPV